ncbi:MAG: hypothetical protein Q8K05_07265, partial [Polaromonas sp.]|nr:hypothetical protein [Polaromonas sp.]
MSSKPALSGFDTGKFLPVTPSRPTAPKVSLTAWQRWEMTSFAQELQPDPPEAAEPEPEPALEPFEPVLLIDEAELTRLRLQAQEAG